MFLSSSDASYTPAPSGDLESEVATAAISSVTFRETEIRDAVTEITSAPTKLLIGVTMTPFSEDQDSLSSTTTTTNFEATTTDSSENTSPTTTEDIKMTTEIPVDSVQANEDETMTDLSKNEIVNNQEDEKEIKINEVTEKVSVQMSSTSPILNILTSTIPSNDRDPIIFPANMETKKICHEIKRDRFISWGLGRLEHLPDFIEVNTFGQCGQECHKHDACVAWNFSPFFGCNLKTTILNEVVFEGWSSGRKTC